MTADEKTTIKEKIASAAIGLGPLPPGSRIGILGGGQLGRMIVLAAARLGYRSHVFCPALDEPALQVVEARTISAYDDLKAIDAFVDSIDVVTFEFENVPSMVVERIGDRVPTRPGWKILHIAQNRLREKDFLRGIGVPTADYREITGTDGLQRAIRDLGTPAVLKSASFGYDGKGQVLIKPDTDQREAWAAMGASIGILETFVDFMTEISVIVARGLDGRMATYDPVENWHVNHILDTTIAPARIDARLTMQAEALARHIAEALDLVGLVAVEMFVTRDGRLLVNELAPRPHNSGHWTIDACVTSQFEQTVRAVCGLPLGATERHSNATMKNLIGNEVEDWLKILAEPTAKVHLYGKAHARPGRKMGHVTRLMPKR
ncbi:MAG TPA: 5-(carboxyamino)imidazole ribonucleotide synthase [Alphaproteobacteria bacterium]|nr:5-(carboxyamino)imidazole ribonucleotide synthase [Alphaproteobacteria bacterium]